MKTHFASDISHSSRWGTVVRATLISVLLGISVTACGTSAIDSRPYEKNSDGNWGREDDANRDSVFGPEGLTLFGGKSKTSEDNDSSGIAINAYLWRATLDTLSFMLLSSADPFGGTILTDWYIPTESPEERFKVNAYILGRTLRADGIRVSVFRQTLDEKTGQWNDAPVQKTIATALEDAILTRARELRIATP